MPTYHAPAKINLSLRILGKRPDGFHELDTLIHPISSLTDTLHFEKADQFSLHCPTPGVPTDDTNLVTRALRLFEKQTSLTCPWKITLEKHIPHGAGLGGGSSDAATTFLALDKLHQTNLPLHTLSEWAATLGSDIPVFLHQKTCHCTGRGDIITPLHHFHLPHPIILLKPSFPVSTPWAYQNWQHSKPLPSISYTEQTIDHLTLINDLERPVFQKHLILAHLKKHLQNHPHTHATLMSGSGSTIFTLLKPNTDPKPLLNQTLQKIDPTLWHHIHPTPS